MLLQDPRAMVVESENRQGRCQLKKNQDVMLKTIDESSGCCGYSGLEEIKSKIAQLQTACAVKVGTSQLGPGESGK